MAGSGNPASGHTPDVVTLAVDVAQTDDPVADLGTLLGRFVVVDRLGQGGMGTVLRAYDTKLYRNVALKLLRVGDDEEARSRIVREAQAMARLAHPNIVAVYDVGEHEGAPFIAMEFVDGVDLRQWLEAESRPWRAIVHAFVEAGRGLAAAHRAGLVHRDFKPDNVLLGDDGRVRVTDFGLARDLDPAERGPITATGSASTLTVAGTVMGTIAYMAPEQHSGERVDARSDQYAYCVSLWEALYGKRPFGAKEIALAKATLRIEPAEPVRRCPRFLRQVLLRGLAPSPEARWPSMDALLEALQQNPSRRRIIAVTGVATLVAVAAWWGHDRWQQAEARAGCEAEASAIAEVWSEEPRARVHRQFASLELASAQSSFDRMVPWLDANADAWREHRFDVCIADTPPHPGSAACLDERRAELTSLVDVLLSADADVVRRSVGLAAKLHSPSRCVDAAWLGLWWSPDADTPEEAALRAQLVAVESQLDAGRLGDAEAAAVEALASAQEVGDDRLLVRARVLMGRTAQDRGDYEAAQAELERAYAAAMASELDPYALEAAGLLAFVIGDARAQHEAGLVWGQVAKAIAIRIEAEDAFVVADLGNTIGGIHQSAGDHEKALAAYREALAITERSLGLDHPLAARAQTNIATTLQELGRFDEALPAFDVAIRTYEAVLGPDSPELGVTLNNYANTLSASGRVTEALAVFERATLLYERAGVADVRLAPLLYNSANAHTRSGHFEQALPLFRRALEIWEKAHGGKHPHVAIGYESMARAHGELGEFDRAIEYNERALAMRTEIFGADSADVARSLNNLATSYAQRGEYARAEEMCEQASEIWRRTLGPDHPDRAQAMINIANAKLWLGELEGALVNAKAAVDLTTKVFGEPHERTALAIQNLGDVLLERGEFEPALREYEDARSQLEKLSYEDTGSRVTSLWIGIGRARVETGDIDGAEDAFEHARRAAVQLAEPSLLKADIDYGVARTSWERGQHRRALELARQARDVYVALGAAAAPRLPKLDAWIAKHD